MTGIFIFLVAVIWGSLSGQFVVQVVTSFVIAIIYLAGIPFSKVSRGMNFTGALVSVGQTIFFTVLFFGGNWITSEYIIDYNTWNAASITSLLSFSATLIYCFWQVPGKILLARMCAFAPYFMEASMRMPANQRVGFARQYRVTK